MTGELLDADRLRPLLVEMEMRYQILGASLLDLLNKGFDPDMHYTPCENTMYRLYEAMGFTRDEIVEDAYNMAKSIVQLFGEVDWEEVDE